VHQFPGHDEGGRLAIPLVSLLPHARLTRLHLRHTTTFQTQAIEEGAFDFTFGHREIGSDFLFGELTVEGELLLVRLS